MHERIRKKESFLSELQFLCTQKATAKKSKPDNQMYLDPKKLQSFQTINWKASIVQDEGNKQQRE